ncbi:hypothetical protein NLG97_g2776 [Lecanicillium saksenae]|uniref:Uncharacterized protein n=1 Tax=Lecanicillium saksenae TaxID=468837 RepID=A0ACC1R057_9HYPO|nr:hypothetical protein NLG97_g2776 [Lecanicillium saksenae]
MLTSEEVDIGQAAEGKEGSWLASRFVVIARRRQRWAIFLAGFDQQLALGARDQGPPSGGCRVTDTRSFAVLRADLRGAFYLSPLNEAHRGWCCKWHWELPSRSRTSPPPHRQEHAAKALHLLKPPRQSPKILPPAPVMQVPQCMAPIDAVCSKRLFIVFTFATPLPAPGIAAPHTDSRRSFTITAQSPSSSHRRCCLHLVYAAADSSRNASRLHKEPPTIRLQRTIVGSRTPFCSQARRPIAFVPALAFPKPTDATAINNVTIH